MQSDPPSSSGLSSPPSSCAMPSSPLSMLSNSPSVPSSPLLFDASRRYPSPSSSAAQSGSSSPSKSSSQRRKRAGNSDLHGPSAKKRKVAGPKGPKTRTTEYLDLDKTDVDEDQKDLFDRLLTALRRKKRIVFIVGAGISVSAGIPDFRSPKGLFAMLREKYGLKGDGKQLFDVSVYNNDKATEYFHAMVRELAESAKKASPTSFHHMLASLAHEGRLMRLYTQNVDCLDTGMEPLTTNVPLNAKGPWPTTIQLHGGLGHMVCTKCKDLKELVPSLFDGPEAPLCDECAEQENVRTTFGGKRSHGVGRLRPRMVLYGEPSFDAEAIGKVSEADLRRVPDAVIVVGTSLQIPGVRRIVKEMCQVTRSRRDGFTAWINLDSEPQESAFKDCWDIVVKGKSDDVADLVGLPRWDEPVDEEKRNWKVTPEVESDKEAHHAKNPVVNIKSVKSEDATATAGVADAKPRLVVQLSKQAGNGGIPTPTASPRPEKSLPVVTSDIAVPASRSKQGKLLFPVTKSAEAVGNTQAVKGAKRTALPAAKRTALPAAKRTALPAAKRTPLPTASQTNVPTEEKNAATEKPAPEKKRKVGRPRKKAAAASRASEGDLTSAFRTTKAQSVKAVKAEPSTPPKKVSSPPELSTSPPASADLPLSEDGDLTNITPLRPLALSSPGREGNSLVDFSPMGPLLSSPGIGGFSEDVGDDTPSNRHHYDENMLPGSSSPSQQLKCQVPSMPEYDQYRRERRLSADTISPTSVPRSMGHLID